MVYVNSLVVYVNSLMVLGSMGCMYIIPRLIGTSLGKLHKLAPEPKLIGSCFNRLFELVQMTIYT